MVKVYKCEVVQQKYSPIRAIIQTQSASFGLYVKSILEQNNVSGLVNGVAAQVQTYIFSGIIRNFLLGYLENRDIDFVVINSPQLRIPISHLREVSIRKNKFDGYKLHAKHLTIDVWDVEKTWGIVQEGMRGTAYSLMNTAFFNFSAIVYNYNKRRFYISDEFCEFYATRVMEVVYTKNPKVETCIINALYYADRYEFIIGASLRKWVVSHYKYNLDFRSAQMSRFRQVNYSEMLIRAFYIACKSKQIHSHKIVELGDGHKSVVLRFDQSNL